MVSLLKWEVQVPAKSSVLTKSAFYCHEEPRGSGVEKKSSGLEVVSGYGVWFLL